MSEFPITVDAAAAAVAIDHAGAAGRSTVIVFGNEAAPAGVLAIHPGDVEDGFLLFRTAIRSTSEDTEALAERWLSGHRESGDPALVIRATGELVLTHGAWTADR